MRLGPGRELLLVDTVGFIQKLPHALVAAFRATLEEVVEADLLLHVVDASAPTTSRSARLAVEAVLRGDRRWRAARDRRAQQGATRPRRSGSPRWRRRAPGRATVSALRGEGLAALLGAAGRRGSRSAPRRCGCASRRATSGASRGSTPRAACSATRSRRATCCSRPRSRSGCSSGTGSTLREAAGWPSSPLLAGALALARPAPSGRAAAAGRRGVRLPGAAAGRAAPGRRSATLQHAWREVLAGDTPRPIERYEKLLRRYPDCAARADRARLRPPARGPARGRGAGVRARRWRGTRNTCRRSSGQGSLAVRRGDAEAALGFYRRAAAVAPDDAVVRKRLAALKLQVTERRVAAAEAALERGDTEAAVARVHGGARGRARADGRPARAGAGARRARRPRGRDRGAGGRPVRRAAGAARARPSCCARSRSTRGRSRSTAAPAARPGRRRGARAASGAPRGPRVARDAARSTGRSRRRRA